MASFCFCEDFTKAILYPYTMIYQAGVLIYSYYHFTPQCLHRSHINIGTKSWLKEEKNPKVYEKWIVLF